MSCLYVSTFQGYSRPGRQCCLLMMKTVYPVVKSLEIEIEAVFCCLILSFFDFFDRLRSVLKTARVIDIYCNRIILNAVSRQTKCSIPYPIRQNFQNPIPLPLASPHPASRLPDIPCPACQNRPIPPSTKAYCAPSINLPMQVRN